VLDTFEEEESKVQSSREIQNLAKTISDLAVLFKDLSVLVVEQGTILDRIDYNILDAKQNIVKANVHIESTLKIE
jgi:syntaxin 16